ncbi:hypothetical protein CC80DRAFT_242781 [Byssothecium circinans]|uniref:Uncharacterized protein n=1 Tax=Byssothecium circinans TaxID=147558 RepID=A0A6A5TDD2_9PLEO|nr:hypothetical protein CC80DRAFT_242781 [Byssothecium circinans]
MSNPSSTPRGYPPPPPWQPPQYHTLPPDGPPPSYDDATHSETSPLLVGPPPDYGAYRAYPEPDEESSMASSEIDVTERSFPEWFGQIVVVCMFVAICYGFWKLAMDFPDLAGQPP